MSSRSGLPNRRFVTPSVYETTSAEPSFNAESSAVRAPRIPFYAIRFGPADGTGRASSRRGPFRLVRRVGETVAMSDELNIGETGGRLQGWLGKTVWISVHAGETGPLLTGQGDLAHQRDNLDVEQIQPPSSAASYGPSRSSSRWAHGACTSAPTTSAARLAMATMRSASAYRRRGGSDPR